MSKTIHGFNDMDGRPVLIVTGNVFRATRTAVGGPKANGSNDARYATEIVSTGGDTVVVDAPFDQIRAYIEEGLE